MKMRTIKNIRVSCSPLIIVAHGRGKHENKITSDFVYFVLVTLHFFVLLLSIPVNVY